MHGEIWPHRRKEGSEGDRSAFRPRSRRESAAQAIAKHQSDQHRGCRRRDGGLVRRAKEWITELMWSIEPTTWSIGFCVETNSVVHVPMGADSAHAGGKRLPLAWQQPRELRHRRLHVERGRDDPVLLLGVRHRVPLAGCRPLRPADIPEPDPLGE
jgi:hypothetical protein